MLRKSSAYLAILALAIITLGLTSRLAFAAAPTNDDIANATALTAFPFTDALSTAEATVEPNEPADCFPITHTVWYKFEAGSSHYIVTADTVGSDYPAQMAFYTGSPGSLQVRYCMPSNTIFTFEASPGETWFVQITGIPNGGTTTGGGVNTDYGNLAFHANAYVIEPIDVSLTVNPGSSVNRTGTTAIVSGTISCSRSAAASVDVQLTQVFAGRLVAIGNGTTYLDCGATTRAWSVEVTAGGPIRLGPGNATAEVNGNADDGRGHGNAQAIANVHLKRVK